jgi:hypothetical protein
LVLDGGAEVSAGALVLAKAVTHPDPSTSTPTLACVRVRSLVLGLRIGPRNRGWGTVMRAIPIESVLRAREGFDPKDLEPLSLGASRLVLGAANGTP